MDPIREMVRNDFEALRQRRPKFSLRSYARFLDISPTSLSLYLNNKRSLSDGARRRVAEKLGLDLDLPVSIDSPSSFNQIDGLSMTCLADWYYFAILSLAETKSFKSAPQWIAKRLNVEEGRIEQALKVLEKLNLLVRDSRGNLHPTGKQLATSDGVANAAVKRGHMQALELARLSLIADPVDRRSFSAMTMAIDPARLPEANRRIKRFRRQLCQYLEAGDKKEVYRLSVQLFPLSKEDVCNESFE